MLKSYCETCQNSNCNDKGTRNINFVGPNKCNNYIGSIEKETRESLVSNILDTLKKAQQKIVPGSFEDANKFIQNFNNFVISKDYEDINKLQKFGDYLADILLKIQCTCGISHKIFSTYTIPQGQLGKIKIRKNSLIYQITTEIKVQKQLIKHSDVVPPEFFIVLPFIFNTTDIDSMLLNLFTRFFQNENMFTYMLLDTNPSHFNNIVTSKNIVHTLVTMRNNISRWGFPPYNLIVSEDILKNMLNNKDILNWMDFNYNNNDILCGNIGSLLGMNIITDAHLHPSLQFIQPNTCFMTAAPFTLGVITQRKTIEARPIQFSNFGLFFEQIQGQTLIETRALAKGEINV